MSEKQLTEIQWKEVSPATIKRIMKEGVTNIDQLLTYTPQELAEKIGSQLDTTEKVIKQAMREYGLDFKKGSEVAEKQAQRLFISTGSQQLDQLLKGGIEGEVITELISEFQGGKTQQCMTTAVIAANHPPHPEKGKPHIVYIDCENTFNVGRVKEIAKERGYDPEETLNQFLVATPVNSYHQGVLIKQLDKVLTDNYTNLIIVDGMLSHLRSEYIGRETMGQRQGSLGQMLGKLLGLAISYKIPVIVTNQVQGNVTGFGPRFNPAGGHIMAHACLAPDTLIQLSNGNIVTLNKAFNQIRSLNTQTLMATDNYVVDMKISHKPLYRIHASGLIDATAEHRFFVLNKELNVEERTVSELSCGDYIMAPSKIFIKGNQQKIPLTLQHERFFTFNKKGASLIKTHLSKKKISRKQQIDGLDITPRHLRRVLNQNYATSETTIKQICNIINLDTEEFLYENCLPYESNKQKQITIPTLITPKLAQLFGYVEGDGCIEKACIRIRDNRKEVLLEYKPIIEELFNIEAIITPIKNKNCYQLTINSTSVSALFTWLTENKNLVFISEEDVIVGYIRGLFDAEGSVYKDKIRLCMKDKKTVQTIQMLLLRLGITSSFTKSTSNNKESYSVLIIPYSEKRKYANLIGFSASDKKTRLTQNLEKQKRNKEHIPINKTYLTKVLANINPLYKSVLNNKKDKTITRDKLEFILNNLTEKEKDTPGIQRISYLLAADLIWKRISKIEKIQENAEVIDIQVEPNQNFIANVFYTHNCTHRILYKKATKGARIIQVIDSPNISDEVCVRVKITRAGIVDEGEPTKSEEDD